jgi:hypothetical protein
MRVRGERVVLSIASLLALLVPATGFAGAERRCSELGSNCVCSEPLNSNTHDGGKTNWEWGSPGLFYNMDDSDNATGCYPRLPQTEMYCSSSPGMAPVPASSESRFLPAGNTLSYVMRHKGGGICHINHPPFTLEPSTGTTFCIRHYRRWDAASELPGPFTATTEPQQKVTTIGGCREGTIAGGGCDFLKLQVSMGPEGPNGVRGNISGGADSSWIGTTNNFPFFGNAKQDCSNNYCRFEVCVDQGKDGFLRHRRRSVEVSPGNGENHVFEARGTVARPASTWVTPGPGGLMFFGQFTPGLIDYATHYIVVRLPYEDPNFWPGPACEVEGGCSGTPPPPPPPAPVAPQLNP